MKPARYDTFLGSVLVEKGVYYIKSCQSLRGCSSYTIGSPLGGSPLSTALYHVQVSRTETQIPCPRLSFWLPVKSIDAPEGYIRSWSKD